MNVPNCAERHGWTGKPTKWYNWNQYCVSPRLIFIISFDIHYEITFRRYGRVCAYGMLWRVRNVLCVPINRTFDISYAFSFFLKLLIEWKKNVLCSRRTARDETFKCQFYFCLVCLCVCVCGKWKQKEIEWNEIAFCGGNFNDLFT